MPDLRIVDEEVATRVMEELGRRARPGRKPSNRSKHLLSGLIRCGACGSNFTLVGKDYYRCSRSRERGTCGNRTSVRVAVIEDAVLGALQSELLTDDLVKLFTDEFRREVERLTRNRGEADSEARRRLAALEVEIDNLAQNFLTGAVSTTLARMLADREAERDRLEAQLARRIVADDVVVPHPALVRRYEEKVARLREALNDETVRTEAAQALRDLIGSVTVHLDEEGRPVLDLEASTATLISFAETTNAPRRVARGRSIEVVAGTGFEPVTFRL